MNTVYKSSSGIQFIPQSQALELANNWHKKITIQQPSSLLKHFPLWRSRPEFEFVLVRDFPLPLSQMFLIKWLGFLAQILLPLKTALKFLSRQVRFYRSLFRKGKQRSHLWATAINKNFIIEQVLIKSLNSPSSPHPGHPLCWVALQNWVAA